VDLEPTVEAMDRLGGALFHLVLGGGDGRDTRQVLLDALSLNLESTPDNDGNILLCAVATWGPQNRIHWIYHANMTLLSVYRRLFPRGVHGAPLKLAWEEDAHMSLAHELECVDSMGFLWLEIGPASAPIKTASVKVAST